MDEYYEEASGDAWTALMVAVSFTLAELDYSPHELRVAGMVLDRIDELLEEALQKNPALTLTDCEYARRLAKALRRSVRRAQDSIETNS